MSKHNKKKKDVNEKEAKLTSLRLQDSVLDKLEGVKNEFVFLSSKASVVSFMVDERFEYKKNITKLKEELEDSKKKLNLLEKIFEEADKIVAEYPDGKKETLRVLF